MKVTLYALAAFVPVALGYVVRNERDLTQQEIQDLAPMTFTGPLTVGGPNVTLNGTAESIWNQIVELNPKYDAWDFPDYQARMEAEGVTKESQVDLETRQSHFDCNPPGNLVGQWNQCIEGVTYLMRLNGYCGAPAGWGGCSRVSCSHNCAIVLCNDNPYPFDVWCGNLAGDAGDIANRCVNTFGQVKGQVYRSRWNTIVREERC